MDHEAWRTISAKMLVGKSERCPFSEEQIQKGRKFLTAWVKAAGQEVKVGSEDVEQGPQIRLLQSFLRVCQDPDAPALDSYATGVRLGYKMRMPRTPAVFHEKKRWRLEYDGDEQEGEEWASNYRTARERQEMLEKKVEADVKLERMTRLTRKEARQK